MIFHVCVVERLNKSLLARWLWFRTIFACWMRINSPFCLNPQRETNNGRTKEKFASSEFMLAVSIQKKQTEKIHFLCKFLKRQKGQMDGGERNVTPKYFTSYHFPLFKLWGFIHILFCIQMNEKYSQMISVLPHNP